jgi:muramoyltetrapeptide carboxypeptidase
MKRRDFGALALLGMGAGLTSCRTSAVLNEFSNDPKKIRPSKLSVGDTVGLIAPASPFSREVFDKAVRQLNELGLKIKFGKNLHEQYGYLAGRDDRRLEDIHAMFKDPEVKAVWCIRGGYGTTRLLPNLDYELIRQNPKILIGYSDITALLHAIFLKTGLIGFHGPVAATTMNDYNLASLRQLLFEHHEKQFIDKFTYDQEADEYQSEIINPGKASGQLTGGNLSLLAAMAGTEFGMDATGKLVFIEDVGEKPYRIDRMFTQLRQSANLGKAKGIILGVFNDCNPKEGDFSLSLKQTLEDRLGDLGIPVYYGFSFGHVDQLCTIPVGVEASFDTSTAQLVLIEPCVV